MKYNRKSKRTKSNIKKFRNAKFNYAKFVKDYYMENGKAYISLNVNSIDDLISKYSVKDYEWINLDFAEYLEECAYYIPTEETIVLEICGGHFSDEEKQKIEKVIKDYYGLKLGDKIIDLHNNKMKSIMLFVAGIISVIVLVAMNNFLNIDLLNEVLLIAMWFFLWEYADMAWLDRNDLKVEKLEAAQLSVMEVKFVDVDII